MKSLSIAALLLMASALTPVSAADMTHERALTASSKEPQNWFLHHGNYEGHRFSQLKDHQLRATSRTSRSRSASGSAASKAPAPATSIGNLEATPIVEDGVMYVPDGWGTRLRHRRDERQEGHLPLALRSQDRQAPGPAMSPAAASTTAASRSGRTRSSRSRSMAGCSRSTRRPARRSGSARSLIRQLPRPSRSRR